MSLKDYLRHDSSQKFKQALRKAEFDIDIDLDRLFEEVDELIANYSKVQEEFQDILDVATGAAPMPSDWTTLTGLQFGRQIPFDCSFTGLKLADGRFRGFVKNEGDLHKDPENSKNGVKSIITLGIFEKGDDNVLSIVDNKFDILNFNESKECRAAGKKEMKNLDEKLNLFAVWAKNQNMFVGELPKASALGSLHKFAFIPGVSLKIPIISSNEEDGKTHLVEAMLGVKDSLKPGITLTLVNASTGQNIGTQSCGLRTGIVVWRKADGTGGFIGGDAAYEGQIDEKFMAHGQGKMTLDPGAPSVKTVEGVFNQNSISYGTVIMDNNYVYEGELDSQFGSQGKGKLFDKNGNLLCEGAFSQGELSGHNTLNLPEAVLEGDFSKGRFVGVVKMRPSVSAAITPLPIPKEVEFSSCMKGDFTIVNKSPILNGYGEEEDCFGNTYKGQYQNNQRNGRGIMTLKGLGTIIANFENGSPEGLGYIEYDMGVIYAGMIKGGNPEGEGFKTTKNGKVFRVVHKDHKLIFQEPVDPEEVKTPKQQEPDPRISRGNQPTQHTEATKTSGGAAYYTPPKNNFSSFDALSLNQKARSSYIRQTLWFVRPKAFPTSNIFPWAAVQRFARFVLKP